MVKKIIWTPRAEKSFDSVILYLQEHWSEKEIINFIEKSNTVIQHISRYPLSYRNAGKDDIREALVTKQTLLLYRIAAGTVYLLYFWTHEKIL
jgi:plasmid stabilization system protein ParE